MIIEYKTICYMEYDEIKQQTACTLNLFYLIHCYCSYWQLKSCFCTLTAQVSGEEVEGDRGQVTSGEGRQGKQSVSCRRQTAHREC